MIYYSSMNRKDNIFLIMVLRIIGLNKVYFGDCRIGERTFSITTSMSCILRVMCVTNVFDTVMDIEGRAKDTNKGQLDLAEIYNRNELKFQDYGGGRLIKPNASYTRSKP